MSILLVDKGNTRLKWQLRRSGIVEASGVEDKDKDKDKAMSAVFNDLKDRGLTGVYVTSVTEEDFEKKLCAWAIEYALPTPCFVKSVKTEYGIINGYDNPIQLGADRWVAMIAAHNKFAGDICVVDVGTALTIDFVLNNGQHLGGFIVAGPELQIQSLLNNTQKVTLTGQFSNIGLGKSTHEAVELGIMNMLGAFVQQSVKDAEKKFSSHFKLVLTGGAATQIIPTLDIKYNLEEDLIFDGLETIATKSK